MFSHVMLGSNDLEASKKFYDAALGALGTAPGAANGDRLFYQSPAGAFFAVTKPINGQAATHANGGTVGFAAASPEQVDAWHAAGVANGGTACEDPPGPRDFGAMKLYLAYLRDPAGNKICALHPIQA
jgi:catechol 2,3-dioxygenase-like lactoylglutathione lyase family enzyme